MSVVLDNVTISYQRHPAVHHISGQFALAQATALLGPNGAGKSTLMKAIAGMLKLDSGEIRLTGIERRDVAYLPQQSEIDRSLPLNVLDLVCTGLWHRIGLFRCVGQNDRKRAQEALQVVGLAEFAERPIFALSSGQFQRVLFARILLQDAQLILLDEPFSAVDTKTTYDLLELIRYWSLEGRTVIAILHDCEQVKTFFPQTLLLAREVIAWGETCHVLTDDNMKRAVQTATLWQERAPICHVDGGMA